MWVNADVCRRRARNGLGMTPHVVIAGGGVGALEGLLALQDLAGDRVHISMLTAARHLTYRPLSVAEPFGSEPAPRYDWEHITRDRGVRWIPDVLEAVRPDAREVDTRDGPPVPYDALLLAVGARPEPALAGGISFAGPRDVLAIRETIEALAPGRRHTIAFVATADTAWTLPLYELALMTAEYGRRRGLNLAVELISPANPRDHGVFGAAASAAVRMRLSDAGIHLRSGGFPTESAVVVALPRLRGPRLPGLPAAPRTRGLRARGRLRPRRWCRPCLGGRQYDDSAAQAGRSRRPTGRCRGSRHRRADRRWRRRCAAVQPRAPRHAVLDGADPLYLQRNCVEPVELQGLASAPLVAAAESHAGAHLGPYLAALDGAAAVG